MRWLQQARTKAKTNAASRIKKEACQIVSLSFTHKEVASLIWEEEDELLFNQVLYDVVASASKGDSITYYCYADNEETTIFNHLKHLLDHWAAETEHAEDGSGNDMPLVFQTWDTAPLLVCLLTRHQVPPFYFFAYTIPVLSRPSPPPWLAL